MFCAEEASSLSINDPEIRMVVQLLSFLSIIYLTRYVERVVIRMKDSILEERSWIHMTLSESLLGQYGTNEPVFSSDISFRDYSRPRMH